MIKNKITLSKINKFLAENKISKIEIQKYLKKKGFTVSQKNKSSTNLENLGSLTRTFLSSIIIISIFFE